MRVATGLVLVASVGLLSWAGVALVRRYALDRLLDVPNERSSHSRSTPRGGGVGLTIAHLLGVVAASGFGLVSAHLAIALAGGGMLVATIGFLDDHGHVRAPLRLLCHFLAFIWAAYWLGGLPPLDFGWGPVDLGLAGTALLVVYLAWFLNLFNFMDGIDGIAGMQCLAMSLAGACLILLEGHNSTATLPLLMLAAASAGFLAWNWPPARIFLGDVGSGYLGFALGTLALWTVIAGWLTAWTWLILGGTFLADATVTLLARFRAGADLGGAHRSHAYQRLSRLWGSHRPVTLVFAVVNCLWLAPWAYFAERSGQEGALAALLALTPLFLIAWVLGAGRGGDIGRG